MIGCFKYLCFIVVIFLLTTTCGFADVTKNSAAPPPKSKNSPKITEPQICLNIAYNGNEWLDSLESSSDAIRSALSSCVKDGYLTSQNAMAHLVLASRKYAPNALGKVLEEYNIWYYKENSGDTQTAGINLVNASGTKISWVVLGFVPEECTGHETWKNLIRLNIPEPLSGGQATVVTWDVPENMKLSKGCLDVLAAGY